MITLAPSEANSFASASPMPLAAPVTIATLLSNLIDPPPLCVKDSVSSVSMGCA